MIELISGNEFWCSAFGALSFVSQTRARAIQRFKRQLLQEIAADFLATRKFGRLIDLIDVLFNFRCQVAVSWSFGDYLHYYLRFRSPNHSLLRAAYKLQIYLYGQTLIEKETLGRINADINQQCSDINIRLQHAVRSGQLLSVRGPNPKAEFAAAISRIMPPVNS